MRDEEGNINGAHQASVHGVLEPAVIDMYATIRALTFGQQMGFSKVIMEGDPLTVINLINKRTQSLAAIGNLADEAKLLVRR